MVAPGAARSWRRTRKALRSHVEALASRDYARLPSALPRAGHPVRPPPRLQGRRCCARMRVLDDAMARGWPVLPSRCWRLRTCAICVGAHEHQRASDQIIVLGRDLYERPSASSRDTWRTWAELCAAWTTTTRAVSPWRTGLFRARP